MSALLGLQGAPQFIIIVACEILDHREEKSSSLHFVPVQDLLGAFWSLLRDGQPLPGSTFLQGDHFSLPTHSQPTPHQAPGLAAPRGSRAPSATPQHGFQVGLFSSFLALAGVTSSQGPDLLKVEGLECRLSASVNTWPSPCVLPLSLPPLVRTPSSDLGPP